jgi:hypothetical protein
VIPAKDLRSYPKGSPEAAMGGGIRKGKNAHHLMVALFEGQSMERITDAQVTVRVREVGLGWASKHLEPLTIADALTYCNFFTFSRHALYTIVIEVRRPGSSAAVTTEFEYRRY